MIKIERTADRDPLHFEVTVAKSEGRTRHRVTMSLQYWEQLSGGGKHAPERVVEAAFLFLLDREPKESILRSFDVRVIARYFPEFERELAKYLAAGI